jgi:hypothetical protein
MRKIYNLVCAAALVCLGINQAQAQCITTSQYPSGTITINAVAGSTTTVTTCNFGGEYSVDNFPSAGVFTITSSIPTDYITVTAGLVSTVSIAQGVTNLTVNIPAAGLYRIHIAAAGPPACTAQSSCRTVNVLTPNVPCVAPVASTITATTPLACPGSTVSFASNVTYTGAVISYQWNTSTVSATGPFTAIPGATLATYSVLAPLVTTWYNMNITCSAGPSSIAATAASVTPAGTTTNSVPYFEGFEGITANNQLPNCSWKASNLPTICKTYTAPTGFYNQAAASGNKYASFRYGTNTTGDYFYSNGLQLNAGITYSASVKYVADGLTGWSEFNLMYGTTQTTTALTSIAAITPTAGITNTVYATASGTFNVSSSGIYFMAIKGVGNSTPWYLTWDDLSVTAPCSINAPTVTAASSSTAICVGSSATLTAGGATSYVWSNASTLTATPVTPTVTTSYTVIGTNAASCTNSAVATINVNAAPVVSIAGSTAVCAGSSATLTASGAATYTWSNGPTTAANVITPTASVTYTAMGTSTAGCIGMSSQAVTVNAAPVVSIAGSTAVCAGSSATLTASGASTYTWSNGPTTAANVVTPTASVTYTAMGTSTNGCTGMTSQAVTVNALPTVSLTASSAPTVCVNTATIALTGSPAGGVYSGSNVAGGVFTPGSTPATFVQTYVFTNTVTTCSNTANNSIVVSGCVGLNNVTASANGLVAYPNPTNGVFTLSFNNGLEKQVTVTDLTGKVVYSTTSTSQVLDINIANLANGIYSVKVQSNQSIEVIKVVKQ